MSTTTSNYSERLLRCVPCSPKTLAKLACVSSDGPPFRLAGRIPLYPRQGLDAWALSKIRPTGPLDVRSPHRRLT